jgi:hypothetical protein
MKTITKAIGSDSTLPTLIGIITSGGIAVVALGFLVSSLAIVVVRLLYWFNDQNFEAHVSKDAMAKLATKAGFDHTPRIDQLPYVLAAYGHIALPKEANLWLLRRMNTFYLSINTITALFIAHLIGSALRISQSEVWWTVTLIVALFLGINARYARNETMQMLEFLSDVKLPDKKPTDKVANGA